MKVTASKAQRRNNKAVRSGRCSSASLRHSLIHAALVLVALSLPATLVTRAPRASAEAAAATAAAQCVDPPSGMVSWWPGDGNANDIAGGNHGTLQNGATFAAGMVNQAFSLDGVDDQFTAPGAGALDISGNQVTLDAWIKLEPNPDTAQKFTATIGKTISRTDSPTKSRSRAGRFKVTRATSCRQTSGNSSTS